MYHHPLAPEWSLNGLLETLIRIRKMYNRPSHPPPRRLTKRPAQYFQKFYFNYFTRWPQYNLIAESWDGRPIGYGIQCAGRVEPLMYTDCGVVNGLVAVMGKSEGEDKNWHGHVTVLTVAPSYRRLGIARQLMAYLERISDE